MKTSSFYENYDAIKIFCKQAQEGLVVVETNSEITKEEFIELLNSDFNVCQKKLKDLVNPNILFDDDCIILVDEFDTKNSSDTVVDLNYNRNWFLNLHRNIIFVLRPSTVNELIRYSASFWSFVTLHKVFSCRFRGIIQPHFINNNNDWYLDGLVKYRASNKKDTLDKSKRNIFYALVWETLRIVCEPKDIIVCLEQKTSSLDKSNSREIAGLVSAILLLSENLRVAGLLREAQKCLDFVSKSFSIHEDFIELEIRKLKLLAEINYSLGFYDKALETYEEQYNIILQHPQIYDDISISALMNNIGVVYYKKECYSEALDCFYKAIEILNGSDEMFVFVNLLFNLSLLHYQIDDFYNSLYYIDSAIEKFDEVVSRRHRILFSKCKVLKAYLVINLGDLNYAEYLLQESLTFLREELEERCTFIMEVHYVFATLYLHKNDLEHAESCALKAYKIMRSIECPIHIRCHIRELLGEIYFYKKDYERAKMFLKVSYSHGNGRNVFSQEISDWVKWAINNCE